MHFLTSTGSEPVRSMSLNKLFRTFLLIGSTSFGGYMALIALVRKNLVEKNQFINDNILTEGIALASMLPGPVAVNVVGYVGYKIGGLSGAVLSVVAVIIPSFLLVTALALFYFKFGTLHSFTGILTGIVPGIAAIILSVAFGFTKKNCSMMSHYVISLVSFLVLFFFSGYWPIILSLTCAGIFGYLFYAKPSSEPQQKIFILPWRSILFGMGFFVLFAIVVVIFRDVTYRQLLQTFSGVSLTLFGGGYVMVPVLKSILVDQTQWITASEFVAGISVGQITPGPILISAAFFGYKLGGLLGAVVATIGIFFPSCFLMIVISEAYRNIGENSTAKAVIEGIKPAVAGMITYSGVSILITNMHGNTFWLSLIVFAVGFFAIVKYNIHSFWILMFAAAIGVLTMGM